MSSLVDIAVDLTVDRTGLEHILKRDDVGPSIFFQMGWEGPNVLCKMATVCQWWVNINAQTQSFIRVYYSWNTPIYRHIITGSNTAQTPERLFLF